MTGGLPWVEWARKHVVETLVVKPRDEVKIAGDSKPCETGDYILMNEKPVGCIWPIALSQNPIRVLCTDQYVSVCKVKYDKNGKPLADFVEMLPAVQK